MSLGKSYPWPRPPSCPRCDGRRLWGHGYVERFFDGYERLPMKRWRCVDCGAVHTMRPASHWRGFWATIALILESLNGKLAGRPWLAAVSRQRQQYWWHGFERQRRVEGAPASLSALKAQKIIVATHSLRYRRLKPLRYDPHRIFAATTATAMS
jgi:hypothetical protein